MESERVVNPVIPCESDISVKDSIRSFEREYVKAILAIIFSAPKLNFLLRSVTIYLLDLDVFIDVNIATIVFQIIYLVLLS